MKNAAITLICREPHSVYAPMLPGLIRGDYDFDAAHVDLRALTRAAGARLLLASAEGLDLVGRTIHLAGRPPLPFDLLSVNIGGVARQPSGSPVQPIGQVLARIAEMEPLLHPDARLAIVGAGLGGTELALADRLAGQIRIALICADPAPVPDAPDRARAIIRDALVDARVEILSGVRALAYDNTRLALSDGSRLDAVAVLWANGVAAAPFLAEAGLGCDPTGAVQVDASHRSLTHPFVFAAGDCAAVTGQARPKSALWSIRAGVSLAANLRRAITGKSIRPPRVLPTPPTILGLGRDRAIGWYQGHAITAPSVWRWKDRMDRRHMALLAPPLPAIAAVPSWQPAMPRQAIATLADIQARLPVLPPAPVPHGAGITQAVHHAACLIDDPFVFGQIAVAAAFAAAPSPGTRPWTATASLTWPDGRAADITAMLHGLAQALAGEGCALTALTPSPGNALSITLAVSFLREPGQTLAPADLRADDVLILTQPLGSGIVLAADRRGLAKSRWLAATLAALRRTNGKAAAVLRRQGAICWTTLGQRGLAGDLAQFLAPTGLSAQLDPDALPALPGARQLASLGMAEHGAADNLADLPPCDPITASLLADPQTSAGLLAALPPSHADACLAALRAAGQPATIIGHVLPRAPSRPVLQLARDAMEDEPFPTEPEAFAAAASEVGH